MGPKTSILITAKNQKTLQSVAGILEVRGYHVTTACCWSQALYLIKNCDIDIAIIDIHMDKSDYMERLGEIQTASPQTSLIITMSDAQNHHIGGLETLGIYNIMPQPYDPNELICALEFIAMESSQGATKNLAFSK
ncbi:response regulator [Chloroflexota bacterium]